LHPPFFFLGFGLPGLLQVGLHTSLELIHQGAVFLGGYSLYPPLRFPHFSWGWFFLFAGLLYFSRLCGPRRVDRPAAPVRAATISCTAITFVSFFNNMAVITASVRMAAWSDTTPDLST
jgi:hypothetical protein